MYDTATNKNIAALSPYRQRWLRQALNKVVCVYCRKPTREDDRHLTRDGNSSGLIHEGCRDSWAIESRQRALEARVAMDRLKARIAAARAWRG